MLCLIYYETITYLLIALHKAIAISAPVLGLGRSSTLSKASYHDLIPIGVSLRDKESACFAREKAKTYTAKYNCEIASLLGGKRRIP